MLAAAISERLAEPRFAQEVVASLPAGPRLALGVIAICEELRWPVQGLEHTLECLGVEPRSTVRALLERGLLALRLEPAEQVASFTRGLSPGGSVAVWLIAHPGARTAGRTVLPEGPPPTTSAARQIREADGLEPIVRVAGIWQRVAEFPLRQTQVGTFYKRDRERLEDDPVIAGPITDALEPLPDMPALWLALARGVGLLEAEAGSDKVTAAPPEFWSENAFHLPQMIAVRWLGLREWHEQGGMQHDGAELALALPYVRPALLLWLATVEPDRWVALEDLAERLHSHAPRWHRPTFDPALAIPQASRADKPSRSRARAEASAERAELSVLESILLGPAYQLGLVRAGEGIPNGRRVVQLTPLGRYLLALGAPPAPRTGHEQFLFAQPNFEVIAYRQGLTPALVGQFSRFAQWSQIGAALAFRLTPESVYRGLEGGLSPRAILELLMKHSQRQLPAGVAEALRTWAGRRDRVTYHASATLVEFAVPGDLEQALRQWPRSETQPAPVVVSDRLLLVEDEASIPFQRFRMTGARDYRRPPEICVEVEADGVTLTLDPARSDLLVDAELARFADEEPVRPRGAAGDPRRRFVVTAASLTRASEAGMSASQLSFTFTRRTGADVSAAVRLMLFAAGAHVAPLATARPLLLQTPSVDVLDGLTQHPETRDHLGDRLGPTTVVIPDESLAALERALDRIGLRLRVPDRLRS